MNKKYMLFGGVFVFSMILVAAALVSYYGSVEQPLSIDSPIEVTSTPQEINGFGGGEYIGELITIEGKAPFDVEVNVTNDAPDGIAVNYIGELLLTQKDSEWNPTTTNVTIEYTVVGNELTAQVIEEKAGYELIYYKDAVVELGNRTSNPQPVIRLSEVTGNLPESNDANNAADADYCNNGVDNYTSCRGAKVWYVPTDAILDNNVLDWNRMSEFYFETNLVQYSQEGVIVVYNGSELVLTPIYTVDSYYNGTSTITTLVK